MYICECAGVCLLHCAATRMQTNTTVTQLDLSDNGLGTEGTVAVADMLKENCFITHINLSDNAMGPPGAYVVGDMLLSNSSITHCYLSGMYACMLSTMLHARMLYCNGVKHKYCRWTAGIRCNGHCGIVVTA